MPVEHQLSDLHMGGVRTIRDTVVDSLREAIISGRFQPGEHLKEREMAARMGISTTPLKEAFRILSNEGLLTTIPRKGTYVSELANASIGETALLRAGIEGLAARLAADKMTDSELLRLEELLGEMERLKSAGDTDGLTRANTKFHQAICAAARNPLIEQVLGHVSTFDKIFRKRALQSDAERSQGYADHCAIAEALRQRNPELAEQRMKAHIVRAAVQVLGPEGMA